MTNQTNKEIEEIYWGIHAHSDDPLMEARHNAVISVLFSHIQAERQRLIEDIGKKRHYDLEEYDHESKLMSVGYNQALSDILKLLEE